MGNRQQAGSWLSLSAELIILFYLLRSLVTCPTKLCLTKLNEIIRPNETIFQRLIILLYLLYLHDPDRLARVNPLPLTLSSNIKFKYTCLPSAWLQWLRNAQGA